MTQDDNNPANNSQPPAPQPGVNKNTPSTRLYFIIPIAALIAIAVVFNLIKAFQEHRINSEPYMLANDIYYEGFNDYRRGDFKGARENALKALQRQAITPEHQIPGMPPYRPNAVTHNATALLAMVSAKTNDCPSYWKYREQTEKLARADWTFVLNGDINKQDNQKDSMLKKIDVVRDAAATILSLEYACPAKSGSPGLGGLPVNTPEPPAQNKKHPKP